MEVEVQRMKKRMRIILALSVMLFFLTACGQEDDKKITLNMAWWGSQVDMMQQ